MRNNIVFNAALFIALMGINSGLLADANGDKKKETQLFEKFPAIEKIPFKKNLTPLVFPLTCAGVAYTTCPRLDQPHWNRPDHMANNSNFHILSRSLQAEKGQLSYAAMSALTGYCTRATIEKFGLSREASACIAGSLSALMSYRFLNVCHSYNETRNPHDNSVAYNEKTDDPINFAISLGGHIIGILAYEYFNPAEEVKKPEVKVKLNKQT